jgi:hypothetical protein
MPTILLIAGWRFFFYADERNEPVHIHARKAEMDRKYWLDIDNRAMREAFSYNMSPKDYRDVRRIIFEHFDHIVAEWNKFHRGNL